MAQRKIWFAVGSPAGPQSPVYTLFFNTNKADVYVSGRAIAHDVKASLHESGRWRFARIGRSSYPTPSNQVSDRAFIKWQRPPPFEPGLTRAVQIIVPPSVVTTWNARLDKPNKVVWVPISPKGSAIYFDVILSAAEWRGSKWNGGEWPGDQAVSSTLLFSHPLANAETVWVIAYERSFDEDEWIRQYQIVSQPIDIRTIFFATHKTMGYGVYLEAPLPRAVTT